MKLPETFKNNSNIMFLFYDQTHQYWNYFDYIESISKYIYFSPNFINVKHLTICENYSINYLKDFLKDYE